MNYEQRSLFEDDSEALGLLDRLFDQRAIKLNRGRVFDRTPPTLDTRLLAEMERIEGMLLGVAVGDALGHSTEWKFDPATRHERFGTIVDHLNDSDVRSGRISDDSQMTFWTLERLLRRGHFDFDEIVGCFVDRQGVIVGMGNNTAASLDRHRRRLKNGTPSVAACVGDPENEGRGNGAAMRFSPIVLPYLSSPATQLWDDAALSAFMTHGNTVALSSAIGLTHLLWSILARQSGDAPSAIWWLDEFIAVTDDLEFGPLPCPLNTDPMPKWMDGFRGTLCDFLDGPVRSAFRKGVPLAKACSLDGFGSRADCTQTIPAVLYVLMCHADSFESAIVTAVNDTKDNDSVAAIVGALVGALHGKRAIRKRWLEGIRSYSLKCESRASQSDLEVMTSLSNEAAAKFLAIK